MATTVSGSIPNFQPGETVKFDVTFSINSSTVDITADTVTLYLKTNYDDTDANAVLTKTADVTTAGANGIAQFRLTPADTDSISPGFYYWEIKWERANGEEYVIPDTLEKLQVNERVSDV